MRGQDVDWDAVARMAASGMTRTQVSGVLGIESKNSFDGMVRRWAPDIRWINGRTYTGKPSCGADALREALRLNGLSIPAAARHLRVCRQTVSGWIRKMGGVEAVMAGADRFVRQAASEGMESESADADAVRRRRRGLVAGLTPPKPLPGSSPGVPWYDCVAPGVSLAGRH